MATVVVAGWTAGVGLAGEWYDVSAGSPPPEVPLPTCADPGNCPGDTAFENSSGGSSDYGSVRSPKPAKPDMNAVIGGMIMQGVLDALLNPPQPSRGNIDNVISAQQRAEVLRAQQAARSKAADSATFRALQSLAGGYKGGSTGPLALKDIDDDLTALAAQAREPFDTSGDPAPGESTAAVEPEAPTPFFGDTMPEADLRLLVEPENDPRVVDLREAQAFIVESLKNEADARQLPAETLAHPEMTHEECDALHEKLDGFLTQREKFAKTIDLAARELDRWERQNTEALTNFAIAGVEHYLGRFQEYLTKRGAAADRLLGIYAKNANTMAEEGIDVAALAAKMQALKRTSTAGQLSTLTSQGLDWSGFTKDGLSALIAGMGGDNAALENVLADPRVAKYFEGEMPALQTALDLTKLAAGADVFGKWAARKVPIVAGCELAVNQSYNALDWALSFKRMVVAHDVYGTALDSAKGIQRQISQMRLTLGSCPQI